jgi:amino acid permease
MDSINHRDFELNTKDNFEKLDSPGLSTYDVALQIISSICGGGIISVPYAMTVAGFYNGLLINVVIIFSMMVCTLLYLRAKDIFGFASVSELSYLCFGRASVFLINILVAFVIFGILTLYLILFADISISLVCPLISNAITESKITYIITICVILTPAILKKNLSEIKL